MRKSYSIVIGLVFFAAVISATAESIWQIRQDGGKFSAYGMYVGQGVKAGFGVWPVASGHSAGAVWTFDGWSTVIWTDASWCENVQGPYGSWDEHWVVPMYVPKEWTGGGIQDVSVNYALYVDNAQGQRFWDNNAGMNYSYFIGNWYRSGDPSYLHQCFDWRTW